MVVGVEASGHGWRQLGRRRMELGRRALTVAERRGGREAVRVARQGRAQRRELGPGRGSAAFGLDHGCKR